jgi:hypothetical protein
MDWEENFLLRYQIDVFAELVFALTFRFEGW